MATDRMEKGTEDLEHRVGQIEQVLPTLATKEDLRTTEERLRRLRSEIAEAEERLGQRLHTKIDSTEQRLRTKIDSTEQRLRTKIDSTEQRLRTEITDAEKRMRTPGQVAHEGARRVANRGGAHRALQHGGEEGAEELVRDGPQLLFALLRFLCRPGRWSTRLKLQRPPEGSAQVDGNVAKITSMS